jgi:hypothetical protein
MDPKYQVNQINNISTKMTLLHAMSFWLGPHVSVETKHMPT